MHPNVHSGQMAMEKRVVFNNDLGAIDLDGDAFTAGGAGPGSA